MASSSTFNELLKHMQRVRTYMQNFYVYGFLTRDDYEEEKSSYDKERQRIEWWMTPYYGFHTARNKRVCFVSFDSRNVRRNPLYRALKSKSFTKNDITLHFLILDVLHDGEERSVDEILTDCEYLLGWSGVFEPSMVKSKVQEYEALGIISSRKEGRDKYYKLVPCTDVSKLAPALAFFSEVADCGVVGSYLEDRLDETCEAFSMKHHYIAQTLDTEILHTLLEAMHSSNDVLLTHVSNSHRKAKRPQAENKPQQKNKTPNTRTILPLYILRSVQDGRMYVLGWGRKNRNFVSCRLDKIVSAKILPKSADAPDNEVATVRAAYDETRPNRWGPSLNGKAPQHVEFTIRVAPWEGYVKRRMYRECRKCHVEELEDGRLMRFSAEIYDPMEMLPWIRSFVGRIVDFKCDNAEATKRFLQDIVSMAERYNEQPDEQAEESGVQE